MKIRLDTKFDVGDVVDFRSGRREMGAGEVVSIEIHGISLGRVKPYPVYRVRRFKDKWCYYPATADMRLVERATPAKRRKHAD